MFGLYQGPFILAIHNSRLSRGRQGEVRVATRADIEKKKDLPPGKVIVRRCRTILVKYEADELESLLKGTSGSNPKVPGAGVTPQSDGSARSAGAPKPEAISGGK